ncbi:unnamed protein product [Calypogeia fissa]
MGRSKEWEGMNQGSTIAKGLETAVHGMAEELSSIPALQQRRGGRNYKGAGVVLLVVQVEAASLCKGQELYMNLSIKSRGTRGHLNAKVRDTCSGT